MSSRLILPALAALAAASAVQAADLARKPLLGLSASPAGKDGPAAKDQPAGLAVSKVTPGLTGEALGLRAGDVLTSLDGAPMATTADLRKAGAALKAGAVAQAKVWRDGQTLTLKAKIAPAPFETYPDADVRYGAVAFQGGQLRDILAMPKGRPDAPVVYVIQGYPCASVENIDPAFGYRPLTAALLAKGIGVYRVEKPQMGDSVGGPACADIDFTTETAAFDAGYSALLDAHKIPASRIFMFGHSMGGLEAPVMAVKRPPRGVAVWGAVARPWHDYQWDILYRQPFEAGLMDPVQNQEWAAPLREPLRLLMLERMEPAKIAAMKPEYDKALRTMGWDGAGQMQGRDYRFWTDLAAADMLNAWKAAKTNVLAMYGASDVVALNAEDHKLIAATANAYRPGTGRFVEVADTTHSMRLIGDRDALRAKAKVDPGAILSAGAFNTKVSDTLVQWIADCLAKLPAG